MKLFSLSLPCLCHTPSLIAYWFLLGNQHPSSHPRGARAATALMGRWTRKHVRSLFPSCSFIFLCLRGACKTSLGNIPWLLLNLSQLEEWVIFWTGCPLLKSEPLVSLGCDVYVYTLARAREDGTHPFFCAPLRGPPRAGSPDPCARQVIRAPQWCLLWLGFHFFMATGVASVFFRLTSFYLLYFFFTRLRFFTFVFSSTVFSFRCHVSFSCFGGFYFLFCFLLCHPLPWTTHQRERTERGPFLAAVYSAESERAAAFCGPVCSTPGLIRSVGGTLFVDLLLGLGLLALFAVLVVFVFFCFLLVYLRHTVAELSALVLFCMASHILKHACVERE